jgi:arsenate reductase
MTPSDKKNILFICTGNSVRSQMGEAFLKYYAGKFFNVYSAGVNPKPLHPITIRIMNERGISLSNQYPKDISIYLGRMPFETIITLSNEAAQYNLSQLSGINEHLHWLFEDPTTFVGSPELTIQKFCEVRDLIEQKILIWLDTIQSPVFSGFFLIDQVC